ncbi:non-ribosomal peptide synthetase [Pseudoalteromonas rhizosphaerae]|uniref:non-ribosomal peptide synthetase n=1 Tax=Pseudoalteromonas rhizosphaerae TaxID=2518973 RepID=UPI002149763B|nr:non-ribosomal peptide synthetase [Pseudoalteromonas rhizosphaerae]
MSSVKEIQAVYPLSATQRGMLFYLVNASDSDENYREQLNFIVSKAISVESIKQAWQAVINHNPVLRSIYSWENKAQPLQAVLTHSTLEWNEYDYSKFSDDEAQHLLTQQSQQSRTRPLEIGAKPAVWLDFFSLPSDNLMTLNFTHLQLDGWSMALITNQLELALQQVKQDQPIVLPQSGDYKDYIKWLLVQDTKQSLGFWFNHLSDAKPSTPLCLQGFSETASELGANGQAKLTFSDTEFAKLTQFCKRNGATLNALMLGCFGLFETQVARRDDAVIGSVVAGRPHQVTNMESIAGFFSTPLPIRIANDNSHSFAQWLKQFQTSLAESWEHSHVSLEQIKQTVKMPITEALFSTLFIFQNFPKRLVSDERIPEQPTLQKIVGYEQSHYPLTLYIMASGALSIHASYQRAHYSENHIDALLKYYKIFLLACVEYVDQPITKIAPYSKRVLKHNPAANKPEATPILSDYLTKIGEFGDNIAVVSDKQQVTFNELNELVNGFAQQLKVQGVKSGHRVAISLDRGLPFIVAIQSILRLGASYIPIDPKMPSSRLEFICEDANPTLLIAEQIIKASLPIITTEQVIATRATEIVATEITDDNEAYVIYTSGSTGTPKGVSVSRKSLLNHTLSAIECYQVNRQSCLLQFSSVSFDTAVEEIYPALFSSAKLVLRTDAMLADQHYFFDIITQHNISILNFPTAFFNAWVHELEEKISNSIKTIIVGGEELAQRSYQIWLAYCHKHKLTVDLFNTYGPTEATVVSTRIKLDESHTYEQRLPIGQAIDNTACHILSSSLHCLPEGFLGEIAISGAGLANGYLNQTEKTDTAFRSHPDLGRCYMSGDLGFMKNGILYYVGRIDHQVKIRGYRVELGEVEHSLTQLNNVLEVVVTVVENQNDAQELVAYYTASAPCSSEHLRSELAKLLPEYMIPMHWVALDSLPKTITGKYDRKQLPSLERKIVKINFEEHYLRSLATIWQQLLSPEHLDEHSHFFHLGGHSILTIKLLAKIKEVFDVKLNFNDIFDYPTLQAQSNLIAKQARSSNVETHNLPSLKHHSNLTRYPLSFQQERVWFLQQLQKTNTAYNFQMTFYLDGPLNINYLEQTLEEIVSRHALWFSTFHEDDGVPYQRIEQPFKVDLTPLDLSHLSESEQQAQLNEILPRLTQRPFDITELPLIRWQLIKLADNYYCLLQVEHHLIHDGWSVGIFTKELHAIYEAKLANKKHDLSPLKFTYADFCLWQREVMSGSYYQEMEQYWLEKLANLPVNLELPYDYPRPLEPSFRGDSLMFNLDYDLYESLRSFSRENGFTLYMTMIAAYYVLLHKYSGQTDINIGAGTASRTAPELHPIMGMMVNSVVLRTTLEGNPTFFELLQRVRKTCLEAYAYQDMPFEKLVQKLSPERMGQANPLFQTMFSFHDAEVPEPDFGGLEVNGLVNTNKSAKLDLNVIVAPHAEQRVGQETSRRAAAVMTWEYSTDLFAKETMEEMVANFLHLLANLTQNPELPIDQLTAINASSATSLLMDGKTAPALSPSIVAAFDNQSVLHPEHTAVINGDKTAYSYLALQQKSNDIALTLAKQVKAGDTIGLVISPSFDLYAAMLAAARLGASYMPIDLHSGEIRKETMLENLAQLSSNPVVLTNHNDLQLANSFTIVHMSEITNHDGQALLDQGGQQSTAYIMYTSGSSGKPKGTRISQAGILRLVEQPNYISLSHHDKWLQHSSPFFDASTLEIYAPLLNGGTLVVPTEQRLSLAQYQNYLREYQISHLWLTAGLFHQLLETQQAVMPDNLKYLLAGGDVLSRDKVQRFVELNPGCELINGYGPTENTTFSYCQRVTLQLLDQTKQSRTVPIGVPVSGTQGYILDAAMQCVPQGGIGELYLAGTGLAKGYLDQQLNQQKFVEHTIKLHGIERKLQLYRTGDIVRKNAQGLLEFIGRNDNQVKIRGFRVELNEIEEVINHHPHVKDVYITVCGDENNYLVAYYQAEKQFDSELLNYCQKALMGFQIPDFFVKVIDFPLTSNGKLDRKAIITENPVDVKSKLNQYVEPQTQQEKMLCDIFAEALNIDKIGCHDNFFMLGGHSLVAVKVIASIEEKFNLQLSLVDIFTAPTVAQLVTKLEDLATATQRPVKQANIEQTVIDEQLSDQELDELLAAMDSEEN